MRGPGFAAALRDRRPLVGYWSVLDSAASTEQVASLGYDFVCLDLQHGFVDHSAMLRGLTAVDRSAVGLVRVGANAPPDIGRALDAGAAGVIVPLVDSAAAAAAAVRSATYPPAGQRSYGPMRAWLHHGTVPADADAHRIVIVMIETAAGLANVGEICGVDGVDGVFVGPADLCLSLGGSRPDDPEVQDRLEDALRRVTAAASASGLAAGIHVGTGAEAARRLDEGFTFACVASDLTHLLEAARHHLTAARTVPANS